MHKTEAPVLERYMGREGVAALRRYPGCPRPREFSGYFL